MIVKRKKVEPCVQEDSDAWNQLEDGVQYRVVGIEYEYYRIQTNTMDWKPYLYSSILFDIVDASVEPDWIVDLGVDIDDEQYLCIGFPEFQDPKFLEDFYNDEQSAQEIGKQILSKLGLRITNDNDNSPT